MFCCWQPTQPLLLIVSVGDRALQRQNCSFAARKVPLGIFAVATDNWACSSWKCNVSKIRLCARGCTCCCQLKLAITGNLGCIRDLSLSVSLSTCFVLLQAAHTFCVSVLYLHVVFDDKHVLSLMCVHACIYVYPRSSWFILFIFYFLMLIICLFLGLLVSILTWTVWMYMYSKHCSSLYP